MRWMSMALSVLAMMFLSYVAGAAVLFLDLPSADFLRRAFTGAMALNEREFATPDAGSSQDLLTHVVVTADDPLRTFDGFTLVTTTESTRATLLDMRGNIVHRWELPFSRAWRKTPHVRRPVSDSRVHWFRCHLYPNGDLLAVYHANGDTPYGYGLAKMDKDSNLLWTFSANVHHDVDVGEDGTIFTLTQKFVDAPAGAPKTNSKRHLADYVVVLSPLGEKLKEIPILPAFLDSPFAPYLSVVERPAAKAGFPDGASPAVGELSDPQSHLALAPLPHAQFQGDILHANSVRVLRQGRAARFPLFKAGDVLLSMRNLDAIAVLNIATGRVVWAARGPWRRQHDADFLENGRLLVYDNLGSLARTRVLEYDPRTQAVDWLYTGEDATSFQALLRGTAQRLGNGNTLLVNPDDRRILEMTAGKQRVWECSCPVRPPDGPDIPFLCAITGARRYPSNLPFLKGETHARP
jgi:hypothetical protein